MTARAASTAATADRILDAALELWARLPVDRIRLEVLAELASVTVPTVTRRFGGKAGVLCALVERELARLQSRRESLAGESIDQIVAYFVDYYERFGGLILKLYAEAALVPGLPELAAGARAQHVASIEEAFEGRLAGEASDAPRRMGQVVVVLDATTWRILRQERGLSPEDVGSALSELLAALVR